MNLGRVSARRSHVLFATALATLAVACAVRLVSQYDDVTDRDVTALQRDVDTFFRRLTKTQKAPACTWKNQEEFYDRADVVVSTLIVRNRARPKNQITVQQLELLDSSLVTLERLHQLKGDSACLTPGEIAPLKANFETSFTAILRFELAKKRG